MEINSIVEKVENSYIFKKWQKDNKKSYLTHLFKMIDDLNKDAWQVGFYNKDDTITSFVVDNDNISILPEEEIFKKKKSKIQELNLSKVKIDLKNALEIAENFQKKECYGNEPNKIIVVLQSIVNNIIYNITYITKTLNILNLKIDATDGKIISSDLKAMMEFMGNPLKQKKK